MSGMFRLADEEALDNLLKKNPGLRVARPLVTRQDSVAPVRRAPATGGPSDTKAVTAIRRAATAPALAPVATEPRKESEIERRFAQQIRAAGLPEPEREYYHITGRDFRLDFAWPAIKLGVEVQGMAHRIRSKFHADMEKRILAQMNGWLVMEISGDMVRHDTAIGWLVILMGQRRQP